MSLMKPHHHHQLWSSFRLLVMPQLSPSMKGGILKKLYIHPGQYVAAYDLVFDITTQTLLNIPSKDGGSIEMQIEVMEDMFVAKLFQQEGNVVEVGQPIAILCDNIDELDLAKDYHVSMCLLFTSSMYHRGY
jgi:pyruvate/2-oxoglutarate dehydrogenase complex dihydrolipoamide acyltransferase (E2) component